MTDFVYDNPLLDALDQNAAEQALAQADQRQKSSGRTPLPKGKYLATLADYNTETVPFGNSPMYGKTRVRATFDTEHDGRTRKLFVDFTQEPITWPLRDGEMTPRFVDEFVRASQLAKALGMDGKPFTDILEQARMSAVEFEVGLDSKDKTRNRVYAIREAR